MSMNAQPHFGASLGKGGKSGDRDQHVVSDAAGFNNRLVGMFLQKLATNESDHPRVLEKLCCIKSPIAICQTAKHSISNGRFDPELAPESTRSHKPKGAAEIAPNNPAHPARESSARRLRPMHATTPAAPISPPMQTAAYSPNPIKAIAPRKAACQ